MKMRERFKNPYFWLGLIGVIFSAAGISLESLTDWGLLWQGILSILGNPFLLLSCFVAILGVFVEPTSSGLKDKK